MRLYRLLLRLYPASFRGEYGAEMCRLYAERRRDARGLPSRLGLFSRNLLDVLRNAPLTHLDILRQDLRYAARTLRHAPAFALTAIAVTALGIGANTAVFSVTDQVLIRSLPYADAARLVKLRESPESSDGPSWNEVSPANYRDWRRLGTSFEAMGACSGMSANLVGEGEPLRLEGTNVTADLLPLLGVRPAVGRLFLPEEDREGAPGTALLSYGLWQNLFGGSDGALGTTVRLNDEPYTVVGVMPQGFAFPSRETQIWTTMRLGAASYDDRTDTYLNVVGKLKPGVSRTRAQAEMDVVARQLERQYPAENAHVGTSVVSLRDEVSPQARLLLSALFGAAGCVLLIACMNLANLLLARALGRRTELAVRAALGAGRERLARQLLTESLLLAGLGGLLGIALAAQAVPLLAALVPTTLPVGPATALDLRVLAFAAALTVLTGVGFGVVPALRLGRGADFTGLREGARGGVGGARKRLRAVLVVVEVAATVVLLVSAGLLLRALDTVRRTDPGFKTDRVMALRTPLPIPKYNSTTRRAEFYTQVLEEVRSLPGVTNAAYATDLPMLRRGGIWGIAVPGETYGPNEEPTASLRYVSSGFFDVLGVPMIRGRDIGDSDTAASPFVAVVSESLARRHWPGKDPIGETFNVANADRILVGVVADIRVRGLEQASEPQVYLPFGQVPDGSIIGYVPRVLVYHAAADPGSLVTAVRGTIRKADPELPISEVRSLQSVVDAETTDRRTQLRALGAFAVLSLLLAGVGIYGVLSFAVSQRTPEIGVRTALGARPADILMMVMGEALALAAIGAFPGMLLAYLTGRSLESLLAGVRPADSITFLTAVAVVVLVTVCGSLVPALRALRIDPVTALRAE